MLVHDTHLQRSEVSTPKLSLRYTHHRSAMETSGLISAVFNMEIVSTYS